MAAFGNDRGGNLPWPRSQFEPDKVKKPFLQVQDKNAPA